MTTKIYGTSDDIIEFEGDLDDEVSRYDPERVFIFFSDGTLLKVRYGKEAKAIWDFEILHTGALFASYEPCFDEDADPYSDVVRFHSGLRWAYVTEKNTRVRKIERTP